MPTQMRARTGPRRPCVWAVASEIETMDLQSSWPPAHAAALRILADEPWTPAAVQLAVERVKRGGAADAVVKHLKYFHQRLKRLEYFSQFGHCRQHTVSHTWVATAPTSGGRSTTDGRCSKRDCSTRGPSNRRRHHSRCLAAHGVTQEVWVGTDTPRKGLRYHKRIHNQVAQAASLSNRYNYDGREDGGQQSTLEGEWRDTQWVRWEDIYHCLQAEGQRAEACALLWATAMRAE